MRSRFGIARRAALGVAAALVLGACVLLAAGRLPGSFGAAPVATIEVARGSFVREVRAEGTLKSVQATPIVVPPASGRSQRVAFVARDGAPVKEGEVVVRFDPFEVEKEAADGRADLRAASSKIDKTKAEADKTRRGHDLDRALAEEELDRARTFVLLDETIFSRHEIIESALDRTLSEKKAATASSKLEASGRLATTDLALDRIETGKARFKVTEAEKGLKQLQIEAPHDGLLVLERKWSGEPTYVGDTLWPGQKVAEIPDLARLEARVHVLEADAAGLKPGLPAQVFIEGRAGAGYPAKVLRVEPVAKARSSQSPVKYFETTLALERTDPGLMRPGQRVQAEIRLEEAKDVIAIPRAALFEKDGRRLVYRQSSPRFTAVEVTVGPSSASRVVIETGLAPGDRIALRDPAERAARIFGGGEAGRAGGSAP